MLRAVWTLPVRTMLWASSLLLPAAHAVHGSASVDSSELPARSGESGAAPVRVVSGRLLPSSCKNNLVSERRRVSSGLAIKRPRFVERCTDLCLPKWLHQRANRVSSATSTAPTAPTAPTAFASAATDTTLKTIAYRLAFCMVVISMLGAAPADKGKIPPATSATETTALSELRDRVDAIYYQAQVSIRYHQGFAGWYGGLDQATRAAALVLAVVAFCGPFIRLPLKKKSWRRASVAAWLLVGLLALTFSLVLNVYPFGELYQKHAIIAQRWSALSSECEQLLPIVDTMECAALEKALARLGNEQKSIEDAEPPGYSDTYLADCQKRTNKALGREAEADKMPEYH